MRELGYLRTLPQVNGTAGQKLKACFLLKIRFTGKIPRIDELSDLINFFL